MRWSRASQGVGALVALLGLTVACWSLWRPWAVDGPQRRSVPAQSGWEWMSVGDVLLVVVCAAVLVVLAFALLRAYYPETVVLSGAIAVSALGLAAAGAGVVWWLTGLDFIVMDDGDLREYGPGEGPRLACQGLICAAVGVLLAAGMRAWELRRAERLALRPLHPPPGRLRGLRARRAPSSA